MRMEKIKQYLWLFQVNFFISAFAFGGGYVVVPVIRKYFVEKKGIMTEETLINIAAVAQSSPGAIAINLSALSGYQTAGGIGAVISCIGAVTPPIIILSIVSVWYEFFAANQVIAAALKGMQTGVAALMVVFVIDMCKVITRNSSLFAVLIIPASFAASFVFHINAIIILLVCCALCTGTIVFKQWEAKNQ